MFYEATFSSTCFARCITKIEMVRLIECLNCINLFETKKLKIINI